MIYISILFHTHYIYLSFIFILVAIAAVIPHLGLMISLIGSVASSTLALIFPPILEIVTFWPDGLGKWKWRLWKDIAICSFGIIGFCAGSTVTIMQIITAFGQDSGSMFNCFQLIRTDKVSFRLIFLYRMSNALCIRHDFQC